MIGPHQHPDPEIGKAQWLRLADIWLLGPAMILWGAGQRLPDWMRVPALIGGIFTIVWNAQNYRRVRELES